MSEKIIIIGSGPAGLTAAIYASRANLNPLVFEGFQSGGIPGGQLMITGIVENFPGFPNGISGPQLMANIRQQAEHHGARLIMEDVVAVNLAVRPFSITSMNGQTYHTHALIVATGATARRLPLESEQRLWGKGISACAVCDGGLPIFRNRALAVIGGGDTAVEEAMHLTQFASKVYLVHRRDQLRASKIMQQRVLSHPKIEVLWNKVVEEFVGTERLEGLRLKDTQTGEFSFLSVVGCFEAIGHIPNSAFLAGQVAVDEMGYIKTMPGTTLTSVDGVFAAGDVQDHRYRQGISAAGSGCMAAIDAQHWLEQKGLI